MDQRARRVGENESLFRTVNDEVHGLNSQFAVISDPMSAVCECGRADCTAKLEVRAAEYEEVRTNPTHFLIVPGHELPDVETVVDRRSRFWVVEKHEGDPARLARATDPRS
ncbi:MAG TPA: hypothetical protein VKB10_01850 [Gaiellaceae bacterium]|nr:hypothetical protein [Gaiellaceae bacterium]